MSRPGKKKKKKKKKLGGVELARVPSGYIASISSKGKLGPAKIRTGSPIPPRPPFSHEETSRPGCDCFHTMYSVAGRRVVSALRSSGAIKLFFAGVVWSAAQNPAILRPRLRPRLALSSRSGHCMHHDDAWPRSQFVGIQARHRGGGGLACSTAAMATQSRHETVRFGPTRSRAPPRRTDSGGHRRCGASHAATPPLWASFSNEVGTLDRHSAQSGPSIRCFNDEAGQAAVCIDLARDARQNLHGTCSHRIL